VEEFGRALRALGKVPTEKEVKQLATSETMTFEDFKQAAASYRSDGNSSMISELRDSFMVFDRENSGCIAEPELRFVLSNMGDVLTDTETDQILKDAPKNKHGEINIEAMIKMLMAM